MPCSSSIRSTQYRIVADDDNGLHLKGRETTYIRNAGNCKFPVRVEKILIARSKSKDSKYISERESTHVEIYLAVLTDLLYLSAEDW